jgi:hypothetical protein
MDGREGDRKGDTGDRVGFDDLPTDAPEQEQFGVDLPAVALKQIRDCVSFKLGGVDA